MTTGRGGLIGAISGAAYQGFSYIRALPEGVPVDMSGLAGVVVSGVLIGAIAGAIVAIILGLFRRKSEE